MRLYLRPLASNDLSKYTFVLQISVKVSSALLFESTPSQTSTRRALAKTLPILPT